MFRSIFYFPITTDHPPSPNNTNVLLENRAKHSDNNKRGQRTMTSDDTNITPDVIQAIINNLWNNQQEEH